MKVLVACEFSDVVRKAFEDKGHEAWSCDIIPSESNTKFHIQGDVLEHLDQGWDAMIAFPPCTHLCVSGARWFKDKIPQQEKALEFVRKLMDAPIHKICIENPIGIISTRIKKPAQTIQPWQFGHGETKATCLWLKNLPILHFTSNYYDWDDLEYKNIIKEREPRIHKMGPSEDRGRLRSITYQGIAAAMAEQWGNLVVTN